MTAPQVRHYTILHRGPENGASFNFLITVTTVGQFFKSSTVEFRSEQRMKLVS